MCGGCDVLHRKPARPRRLSSWRNRITERTSPHAATSGCKKGTGSQSADEDRRDTRLPCRKYSKNDRTGRTSDHPCEVTYRRAGSGCGDLMDRGSFPPHGPRRGKKRQIEIHPLSASVGWGAAGCRSSGRLLRPPPQSPEENCCLFLSSAKPTVKFRVLVNGPHRRLLRRDPKSRRYYRGTEWALVPDSQILRVDEDKITALSASRLVVLSSLCCKRGITPCTDNGIAKT